MNKAVISNRIFFRLPDHATKNIIKELTHIIESRKGHFVTKERIKNYTILKSGIVSIPSGRLDLIPEDYEIEDKRAYNPVPFPNPKFELRPEQLKVFQDFTDSGFLNAKPGWGKTFTALHIARNLGQKTLVVTHTTMLRDQWIVEANSMFGMPIGKIGSQQFDIEDHAIVIGNIQSVIKHIDTISKEFGTLILDEAHHVPATTFQTVVDKMHSRYKIGLSGTIDRKDGKQVIFKDYFGPKLVSPATSGTMTPLIKIVKTDRKIEAGAAWASEINKLLYDPSYQSFISVLALAHIDIGHKVLIIADRVEFLKSVKEIIGESCVLVTGEKGFGGEFEERTKLLDQIETGEKSAIAGSTRIFSEGISVDPLSVVILASPTSNTIALEQIIGRINRQYPNKLQPIVIDIQFKGVGSRQNTIRKGFYISKGWKIETYSS